MSFEPEETHTEPGEINKQEGYTMHYVGKSN
jgi:hypothetical protein